MRLLRGLLVFLASSVFGVLLYANVIFIAPTIALDSPPKIKSLVQESGAYDHFLKSLVQQASNQNAGSGNGLSLDNPLIRSASETAFTPKVFQDASENFIDGVFNWLNGKSPEPDFKIDFSSPKAQFVQNIGEAVRKRLDSLPTCPRGSAQEDTNPLTITCKPAGLSLDTQISQLEKDVSQSLDFINKPVTAKTLKPGQSSAQKTIFEKLTWAPKVYRLRYLLITLVLVSSVLIAAIIVLASTQRRLGWRRIAHSLLGVGLLLIASSLIITIFGKKGIGGPPLVQDVILPLLTAALRRMEKGVLALGGFYAVAAIIIYILKRSTTAPPPTVQKPTA